MFHEGRGTWAALASDLSEELRFLAESFVLAMARRREIAPAEFVRAGDPQGILLRYESRRVFIARFEERLLTSFTPPGEEKATTYLELIAAQARRLREFVTGRGVRPAANPCLIRAVRLSPRGDTGRFPGVTASFPRDTARVAASRVSGAGYRDTGYSWKRITPGNRANA